MERGAWREGLTISTVGNKKCPCPNLLLCAILAGSIKAGGKEHGV